MFKNELSLNIDVIIFKDEDYFIAYAPTLDFSAYGKSEEDAKSSFDISIKLMIEEVVEQGNLEKMLLEYGWSLVKKPVPFYRQPAVDFTSMPFSSKNIVGNDQTPISVPTALLAYA